MEVRKHPTHKRTWIIVVVLLVGLSFIPLVRGLSIRDQGGVQELFDLLFIVYIFLLGSAFVVMIAFSYLGRCPVCGSLMFRFRSKTRHQLQFSCVRCNIVFDTGIEED